MKKYKTKNPKETGKAARELAAQILKRKRGKKAAVVALTGELGAGKTTFIKSFMREAGVKRRITSPTFLILRRFGIKSANFKNIFHIDAYRLENPEDLKATRAKEALASPENIVLVEWAEKIKKVLPKDTIWVKFKYGKDRNEREVIID